IPVFATSSFLRYQARVVTPEKILTPVYMWKLTVVRPIRGQNPIEDGLIPVRSEVFGVVSIPELNGIVFANPSEAFIKIPVVGASIRKGELEKKIVHRRALDPLGCAVMATRQDKVRSEGPTREHSFLNAGGKHSQGGG